MNNVENLTEKEKQELKQLLEIIVRNIYKEN